MNLKDRQEALMSYITEDKNSAKGVVDESLIVGSKERLQVYRNGYRIRLVNILKQLYPALDRLFGASPFSAMAIDYLEQYPPTGVGVDEVGALLPIFLQQHLGPDDAVVELASLEWDVYQLGIALNQRALSIEDWQACVNITPESFCFKLCESVMIVEHNFNTWDVWQALSTQKTPPDIVNSHGKFLLWRDKSFDISSHKLSEGSVKIMRMFKKGASLIECCDLLAKDYSNDEDAIKDISHKLACWIEMGLFVHDTSSATV